MISIQGITKSYGKNKGVFDLHLSIKKGEVFGFLGPNGAGKSTTIRLLIGMIRPDQGRLTIDQLDCFEQASLIHQKIGYLPGELQLIESLTGRQLIQLMADIRHQKPSEYERLVQRFSIDDKVKIKRLSKGNKQKIGLLLAACFNPDIYILDEPTSGFDPLMQATFIEWIQEEKEKGKTIFLSSHLFEEVEQTCDRIGILKQGHLVELADLETLQRRHSTSYEVFLKNETIATQFAKDFNGIQNKNKVILKKIKPLEEIFKELEA